MLSIRQSQAHRPETLIILLLLRFFEHITQVCLFIVKPNQINIDYTRDLKKDNFWVLGNYEANNKKLDMHNAETEPKFIFDDFSASKPRQPKQPATET